MVDTAPHSRLTGRALPSEPSLSALLSALRGRWRLVLGAALGACLAATLWVRLTPPEFEARMVVGPSSFPVEGPDEHGDFRRLATLQGLAIGAGEQVSDYDRFLYLLTSEAVARRLVEGEGGDGLVQDFFPAAWDAEAGTWRPPPGPWPWFLRHARILLGQPAWHPPRPDDVADAIAKRLTMDRVRGTAMRRLGFLHRDREQALTILGALRFSADAILREAALERVDAQIAYLSDQRDQVSLAVHTEALDWLLRRQERERMLLSVNLPYAAAIIEPVTAGHMPDWPDPVLVLPLATAAGAAFGTLSALFIARRTGNAASRVDSGVVHTGPENDGAGPGSPLGRPG